MNVFSIIRGWWFTLLFLSFGHIATYSQNRVLFIEIRGLTYELLERGDNPNLKYLIESGTLLSLPCTNSSEADRLAGNTAMTEMVGKMVRFADCLKSNGKNSLFLATSATTDTLIGIDPSKKKLFRTNEQLVKDFINTEDLASKSFYYLNFRPYTAPTDGNADSYFRFRMAYYEIVDSLLGVLFKSLQERELWQSTRVYISTMVPQSRNLESTYSPLFILDSKIPHVNAPNLVISRNDLFSMVSNHNGCSNPEDSDILESLVHRISTSDTLPHLVARPDVFKFIPTNTYGVEIEMVTDQNNPIYFTIDGTDPMLFGNLYSEPLRFKNPGLVKIKAVAKHGMEYSRIIEDSIRLMPDIQLISVKPLPSPKYVFDGASELVDHDTATTSFMEPKYLGWQGQDVEILFNFGNKRKFSEVDVSTLQDYVSWIFAPIKVELFVGNDLVNLTSLGTVNFQNNPEQNLEKVHFNFKIEPSQLQKLGTQFISKKKKQKRLSVRYLKVKVTVLENAPEWFKIPGAQVWLFIDEISIK